MGLLRQRGVFQSVTRELSVHQRIRFRGTSRQGLRPDFGCDPRCLPGERHQARHRRRQPGQHAAGVRDARHHQQDRDRRRRPRAIAAVQQIRQPGGGQSRADLADRAQCREGHRLRSGRIFLSRRRDRGPAARPVARHRHGGRRQEEEGRRARGRRRSGHDVRLRLHRERGLREELVHAGADLLRPPHPEDAVGASAAPASCSICSPTPRAR